MPVQRGIVQGAGEQFQDFGDRRIQVLLFSFMECLRFAPEKQLNDRIVRDPWDVVVGFHRRDPFPRCNFPGYYSRKGPEGSDRNNLISARS